MRPARETLTLPGASAAHLAGGRWQQRGDRRRVAADCSTDVRVGGSAVRAWRDAIGHDRGEASEDHRVVLERDRRVVGANGFGTRKLMRHGPTASEAVPGVV